MAALPSLSDERVEQVLFTLPRIDLHLPLTPVPDITHYDFDQPGRDWIVQGEQLEYFLVVRLSDLEGDTGASKPASSLKTKPSSSLSSSPSGSPQIRPKEASADPVEMSQDEQNKLAAELLHDAKTPTLVASLFNKIDVRTEYLRANHRWYPTQLATTVNMHLSKHTPVLSDGLRDTFQFESALEGLGGPARLNNGDLVFRLTTQVHLKPRHLDQKILLATILQPKIAPPSLNELVSSTFKEPRSTMRVVTVPLKVIFPLKFEVKKTNIGSLCIYVVEVENAHGDQSLTLSDATINILEVKSPQIVSGEQDPIGYHHYFDLAVDGSDLPVILLPGEGFNVVVRSQPRPAAFHGDEDDVKLPELLLRWTLPSLAGSMVTPITLPADKPNRKKLLISFDIGESPVKLHSIFPLSITVTNLSSWGRDIVLEVPLAEIDQSERFFVERASLSKKSEPLALSQSPRSSPLPALSLGGTSPRGDSKSPHITVSHSPEALGASMWLAQNHKRVRSASYSTPPSSTPKDSHKKGIRVKSVEAEDQPLHSDEVDEGVLSLPVETQLRTPTTVAEVASSQENKHASILCLEKVVHVGLVKGNSQATVTVHCLALREGYFTLSHVKLLDRASDRVYMVKHPCEVFVVQ